MKGRSLAKGAAILCGKPAFQRFLAQELNETIESPERAALVVRTICQVKSRAELDHNAEAARTWRALVRAFNRELGS